MCKTNNLILNPDQLDSVSNPDITNTSCEYINLFEDQLPDVTANDLRIVHYNIRGLMGKQHDLNRLMHRMDSKGGVPIVMLNETWLRPNTIGMIDVKGYKLMSKCRKGKKGGGVGFLVHENLKIRERPDLDIATDSFEHMTIELKTHRDSILLCSIYRPPNTSGLDFLADYKKLVTTLLKENDKLAIGSDHNLDLLKYNEHSVTWEFIESNLDLGLFPQINRPTRITHSTATLIDNIFISNKLSPASISYICIEDHSDHLPCLVTLENVMQYKQLPIEITTRRVTSENIEKINDTLLNENWTITLNDLNTDEAFDLFHAKLTDCFNLECPERTIKLRPDKRSEPWITPGLLSSIKKQNKLYTIHLNDRENVDKLTKYKEYRNTLRKILRYSRINHYILKCNEYKHESKKLWSLMNEVIKKEKNKTNVISYLQVENRLIRNPKGIAKEFNQYFSNVGKTYANKVRKSKKELNAYLEAITRCNKSMFLTPVTALEVERIISNLKNKNSSGYDSISNTLLKDLRKSIVLPLTIIFNKSLQEGTFPTAMKLSDVTPLYKNKDRHLTSNYRPISLLLTISKVLEKVVYVRTYGFLENTGQIYSSQYGFRPKHSCTNAISELTSEIVKGWEHRKNTVAAFLDLSKAFDTLNHKVLLQKLERYGIRDHCNNWFKSYLLDRKMRTKCVTTGNSKTILSDYNPVEYGTPQGSCLGPLLFLIFSNDLYLHVEYCKIILFADDTTIYVTEKNNNYAKACLEHDLQNIVDWFRANSLTLNLEKSAVVNFNPNPAPLSLKIDKVPLPDVTTIKFLGVWLDNKLNWDTHINKLCIKINQNLNFLKMGKNMLNESTKLNLYYAQIHSHITYSIMIWGNMMSKCQLDRLQKHQNKCVRLVTNGLANTETYKKLKILNITSLVQLENYKHGYKLNNNLLPIPVAKSCTSDSTHQSIMKQHKYNTRNKHLPNVPKATNKKYRSSFLYQHIKDFEQLPNTIKNESTTFPNFVRRCKKHILNIL